MKELNEFEMSAKVGSGSFDAERLLLNLGEALVGNPIDHHVDMYGNPVEI